MIARIVRFVAGLWGRKSGEEEKLRSLIDQRKKVKKILVGWEIFERVNGDWRAYMVGNGRIVYRSQEVAEKVMNSLNHPSKVLPVYAISSGTDEETTTVWGKDG